MTNQDKIIALAKLDGWTKIGNRSNSECVFLGGWNENIVPHENAIPHYLTSYDAIIPLIQKQDGETTSKIIDEFNWICRAIIKATPAELADALLKAKGLL